VLFTRTRTTGCMLSEGHLKAHTERFEALLQRAIEAAQPLLEDDLPDRLNALVKEGLLDEYFEIIATIQQTIEAQDEILSTVRTVRPLGVHPPNFTQLREVRQRLAEHIGATE
jgi:hypothetical protein